MTRKLPPKGRSPSSCRKKMTKKWCTPHKYKTWSFHVQLRVVSPIPGCTPKLLVEVTKGGNVYNLSSIIWPVITVPRLRWEAPTCGLQSCSSQQQKKQQQMILCLEQWAHLPLLYTYVPSLCYHDPASEAGWSVCLCPDERKWQLCSGDDCHTVMDRSCWQVGSQDSKNKMSNILSWMSVCGVVEAFAWIAEMRKL